MHAFATIALAALVLVFLSPISTSLLPDPQDVEYDIVPITSYVPKDEIQKNETQKEPQEEPHEPIFTEHRSIDGGLDRAGPDPFRTLASIFSAGIRAGVAHLAVRPTLSQTSPKKPRLEKKVLHMKRKPASIMVAYERVIDDTIAKIDAVPEEIAARVALVAGVFDSLDAPDDRAEWNIFKKEDLSLGSLRGPGPDPVRLMGSLFTADLKRARSLFLSPATTKPILR